MRKKRLRALACAAVLPLFVSVPRVTAQEVGDTAGLAAVLDQARQARWLVRATLVDGIKAEGTVQSVAPAFVSIGEQEIAPLRIVLLERQRADRKPAGRGALVGAGVGLVIGVLYAFPLANALDANVNETRAIIGGTVTGAVLGATIGGILSIGKTTWEAVWGR